MSPHTDVVELVEDLLSLALRTLFGESRPAMYLYDCRQIGRTTTGLLSMRAFVDKRAAFKGKDGVMSAYVGHCFPYPRARALSRRILVVTDKHKAKADRLAAAIGEVFVSMHGKTAPVPVMSEDGISAAIALDGVLAGNPTILRQRIERKCQDAAAGPICKPIAVRLCFAAEEGVSFPPRFGGENGPPNRDYRKIPYIKVPRPIWPLDAETLPGPIA